MQVLIGSWGWNEFYLRKETPPSCQKILLMYVTPYMNEYIFAVNEIFIINILNVGNY